MTQRIIRYQIPNQLGEFVVTMPWYADTIDVEIIGGNTFLTAIVDDMGPAQRRFFAARTMDALPEHVLPSSYFRSFISTYGDRVHLFDLKEDPS